MLPNKAAPASRSLSRSQSGNAFMLVMIGVVLFGALMYTFSRGARQGEGNLSGKRATIAAQDIMSFAQKTERATNRLLGKGCSESQLNFHHDPHNDNSNSNAPPDHSCSIFHPAGANLTFPAPDPGWYDNRFAALHGHKKIIFAANARMRDIGAADRTELILWVPFVKAEICAQINRLLGINTPPIFDQGPYAGYNFTGSFANSWDNHVTPSGHFAACVQEDDNDNIIATTSNSVSSNQNAAGSYHFYQILIAR